MAKRFSDGHWPWQWFYYGIYDEQAVNTTVIFMRSGYKISEIVKARIKFVQEYDFHSSAYCAY